MIEKIIKFLKYIKSSLPILKKKGCEQIMHNYQPSLTNNKMLHNNKEQEAISILRNIDIQYSNVPYIQKIISKIIKNRLHGIADWRDGDLKYTNCSRCNNLTVNLRIFRATIDTNKDSFIMISECDIRLCPHCKSCEGLKYKEISNPQEIIEIREQIRKEEEIARQFELNYHRIVSGELPIELSDSDTQELTSYSKAKHREEEYLFLRNESSLKQGNIKAVCISNQDPMTGKEEALEIGEAYMIDFVIIGSSYTHVYLSEFPDKSFNPLLFNYYQDDEKFFLNKDYKALRITAPDIFTRTTLIMYRDLSKEAMDNIKQKYDRLIIVNRSDILSQVYTN